MKNIFIIKGLQEGQTVFTVDNLEQIETPNKLSEIYDDLGVINLQKSKTTSYTVSDTDNGYTIWLNPTAPITITVNDGLSDKFECEFINISTNDVTFVAGTATLNSPDGLTLSQNKVCTLLKRLSNNDYWLKGELA